MVNIQPYILEALNPIVLGRDIAWILSLMPNLQCTLQIAHCTLHIAHSRSGWQPVSRWSAWPCPFREKPLSGTSRWCNVITPQIKYPVLGQFSCDLMFLILCIVQECWVQDSSFCRWNQTSTPELRTLVSTLEWRYLSNCIHSLRHSTFALRYLFLCIHADTVALWGRIYTNTCVFSQLKTQFV